jgi:hypothetical protein
MAPQANVPLTINSTTYNNFFYAQMAIGTNVIQQQQQTGPGYYWFVVLNRQTLAIEFNQIQTQPDVAPNLGSLNDTNHILLVGTMGVGLNNPPQGALFAFLSANGAGVQLRRVEQVAEQLNCGSLGTFGYALVSVLGNMNLPGFEASVIGSGAIGPILTAQLMPTTINGTTVYTPVELSNA